MVATRTRKALTKRYPCAPSKTVLETPVAIRSLNDSQKSSMSMMVVEKIDDNANAVVENGKKDKKPKKLVRSLEESRKQLLGRES